MEVKTAARAYAVLLVLAPGCEQDPAHEPNWLFRGEWIDVDGQGRSAEETCAGTFEYLDLYAMALAAEFGVDEHLGVYRWYSQDQYDAELPCGDEFPFPYSCAMDDGVHSAFMPLEHEIVHRANTLAGNCPSLLAEGLAEYYATGAETPSTDDIEKLEMRLADPTQRIANDEYGIAGRFAAFLVNRFDLDTVLDVCKIAGRHPDGAELSSAMMSAFGMSTKELLGEFANELETCSSANLYQSRVFACGLAGAAASAGVVTGDLEAGYDFGCAGPTTVGPFVGEIWITQSIDFAVDGIYDIELLDEFGEIPEVELILAKCEPCGWVHSFAAGEFIGPEQFEAGRYSLELRAEESFSGRLTVTFARLH